MTVSNPSIEFRELDMDLHDQVKVLHDWSVIDRDMLPLTEESLARHHLSTLAYLGGELAGYAAVSVIYSAEVVEFGGMVVNPEMRRRHIGSSLTKHVVKRAREEIGPEQILAFGNDKSAMMFLRLGARQVKDTSTLPPEVWKLCHICPRLEFAKSAGKSCCERVFDLTDIHIDI